MGWQDMSTAPRDGSEFLVEVDERVTWCQHVAMTSQEIYNETERLQQHPESTDGWVTGVDYFDIEDDRGPKLWRPMPARRSSSDEAEVVAWPGRKFCETAERNATELAKWIKGKDDKQVASDAALAIRTLLASLPAAPVAMGGVTEEMAKTAIAVFLDDPEWDMGLGNGDKIRRMVAALLAALSPPGKGDGK